jgi:hypothetical protein
MGLQFFENGYFPHGSGRYPFILVFQFDFFEGDNFFGGAITSPVDDSIGSFSD